MAADVREMTEQATEDIRESMNILVYKKGEEYDEAFDIAKMVVANRMRALGERY